MMKRKRKQRGRRDQALVARRSPVPVVAQATDSHLAAVTSPLGDDERLASLGQPLSSETHTIPPPVEALADASEMTAGLVKLLAETGTGLWRLRRTMMQVDAGQSAAEMRRARRQIESIFDTLAAAGVEIRDHTDEAVPQGGVYALKVIAYEPTLGLTSEQVVETIKPTIYFKNRMIQMGEVVIGTLETSAS